MLHLSYETAQARSEEDHAAVHLINLLVDAQHHGEPPLSTMDLPTLRNAVKNPVEIERLASILYRHDLLEVATHAQPLRDVLPFRVAGVLLPVVMATVALEQQDTPGTVLDATSMVERLAVAMDRLCGWMYPGFSVNRQGVIRPGHDDGFTAQRLEIGLAIVAVMRDVYEELLAEGLAPNLTDTALSQW